MLTDAYWRHAQKHHPLKRGITFTRQPGAARGIVHARAALAAVLMDQHDLSNLSACHQVPKFAHCLRACS